MMKKNLVLIIMLVCLGSVTAMADPVTFTLVNPDLTGTPGQTLTWMYDVTNNSGGDIIGLSVNSDLWQNGTPDAGAFDGFGAGIPDGTELIGSLFSFTGDPNVSNSFNSGVFDLQIFLSDGSIVDLFQNYSATITPGTVSVPEPPSAILLVLALLPLGVFILHKRGRSGVAA